MNLGKISKFGSGVFLHKKPPSYILQQIKLPASDDERGLYVAHQDGNVVFDGVGIVKLGPDSLLSFNGYKTSFYESYWSRFTNLNELEIQICGLGSIEISIIAELRHGGTRHLVTKTIALIPDRMATVGIPIERSPHRSGRIFFDIRTGKSKAELHSMAYATPQATIRPVHLGIAICTFNREPFVNKMMQKLMASPLFEAGAMTVTIVNQGASFKDELLISAAVGAVNGVRVIEQKNYGGAGGFTRAAYETVKANVATHVVFLDDDVEIDPGIFQTMSQFLGFAEKPIVVGGAMLDLYRPNVMYEAGALVEESNLIRANLHNIDLNQLGSISQLRTVIPCHFNGWWCCAIPVDALRKHGLPLPIFIRGDDMEYGIRLHEAGIETISLPPVSVWHEPFYAKPPNWLRYYDLRNRLIMASIHDEFVQLDAPTVILRRVIDSLLKHDYMHAALAIEAVKDYMAGPEVLAPAPDVIHQRVDAIAKRYPNPYRSTTGLRHRHAIQPPSSRLMRQISLAAMCLRLWRGKVERNKRPEIVYIDSVSPWTVSSLDKYVLADNDVNFSQSYHYDRDHFRALLKAGIDVWRQYCREAARAAHQWRDALPELSSWERWGALFDASAQKGRPNNSIAPEGSVATTQKIK